MHPERFFLPECSQKQNAKYRKGRNLGVCRNFCLLLRLMRFSKLPIVKAKVGPQILSLVCDEKIFDIVPVKKEVKATVSGIYITDVKGLHGKPIIAEQKKKGLFKRAMEQAQSKAGAKPLK